MSKYIDVTADVGINIPAIQKKVESLVDDTVMLEVHNLLAKTIDPWVPFLEGPLSQTLEITPQYVRYLQPYAHYQYMGINFNHTTTYHPLASAQWDKVAMQSQLNSFEEQVKQILIRRAKELYG
jgi:hypothetical protein